ncbi:MAG: tetratricopeptide repeat protein [Sphingomonadales bacterium]|nr:tetratricopeptide repeat protein [Sphingomonadales bacterium]
MSLFLAGCDSRASRAEAAFNNYQAAMAAGDLQGGRMALLKLVAANEDVPSYWVELGKLQYQLKDYGKAYYAFTRANELNRSDPDVLRYLTQIALQSGDLEAAEQHSKELDLLTPGDPMVKITGGLIALRRGNFAAASQQADQILAAAPLDANANILKARALVGLEQPAAAVALLEEQIARQPGDALGLKALIDLHRTNSEWKPIVALGQRYRTLIPSDRDVALQTIEAAFRTGDVASARTESLAVLKPDATVAQIQPVLDLWRQYWKGVEPLNLARQLGAKAGLAQRVAYGHYLNLSGAPNAAEALVADRAKDSPSPTNLDARAVYFDALAHLGRQGEARTGLEDILSRDPDNDLALMGLASLLVATGNRAEAVNTARKLVAVDPTGVDARLLLARCYQAQGDRASAERALWDAFHEIPAAERIYTPLRAYLGPDSDEARRLDGEYADQRQRKIMQDSI